jgi:lysophospholipase L1-like esterase
MNMLTLPRFTRGAGLASLCLVAATLAQAAPVAAAEPEELRLLDGKTAAGWQFYVSDFESRQALNADAVTVPKPASPKVPQSAVGARRSAKVAAGDAVTLHWKDAWYAGLRLEDGKPVDLRPFVADGTLEFDLNVVEMAKGGLHVAIGCGKDCHRKVNFILASRAMAGKGWQHMSFAMSCFARAGDDFSAIPQPFILDGSGTGEATVANVRYVRHGKSNTSCPDYRTEAFTPSPLNQVWALEWWQARHEKKLQEVRDAKAAGKSIDLVFIGDSITQGWEDAGRKVWDEHFAPQHALALGFGGDHTENVLWRLQHGEVDGIAPKVAVVMIGTNNTGDRMDEARVTATGIQRILQELRTRLPTTRVLLLAVFPRDEQPDSALRQRNDQLNGLISGLADGERVVFLNINPKLMRADGTLSKDIMPDLLHLNEQGYRIWTQSITPTLRRLMAAPAPSAD